MLNRFIVFVFVLFLIFPWAGPIDRSSGEANETNQLPDRDNTLTQKRERPKVKKETISIAGKEQEFTFTLFDSSEREGFPLPFTTYVPEDIVADTLSSDEGDAVVFIANVGGKRNEDALVHVFYFPERTTDAEARAQFKFGTDRRHLRQRQSKISMRYKWSLMEYDFVPGNDHGLAGYKALGRRKGRFFTLMLRYPEGQEEELAPRGKRILEEFRWKDTGQGLM